MSLLVQPNHLHLRELFANDICNAVLYRALGERIRLDFLVVGKVLMARIAAFNISYEIEKKQILNRPRLEGILECLLVGIRGATS